MRAVMLRIAGCLLFLPLVIPFMLIASGSLLVAFLSFLARGADPDITGRIVLNPLLDMASELPLMLFQAAERAQGER